MLLIIRFPFFNVLAGHHDDKLAARLGFLEMGYKLSQCAAHALFVYLGYLAAGACPAVFAKIFGKLLESLQHSVGRLIEYHRACLFAQTVKPGCTPLLLGQEAFETESVARQSR